MYSGVVSITDWVPTFLALAGVDLGTMRARTGAAQVPPAVDGIDVWPALSGSATAITSTTSAPVRSECYISPQVFRMGRWKLHVGNAGTRDILGCGGGWVRLPTNASATCRAGAKCGPANPIDAMICNGCTESSPCLFDVGGVDKEERHNVAETNTQVVAAMRARLGVLQATMWVPPTVLPNTGGACAAAKARGGVLGPWQQL